MEKEFEVSDLIAIGIRPEEYRYFTPSRKIEVLNKYGLYCKDKYESGEIGDLYVKSVLSEMNWCEAIGDVFNCKEYKKEIDNLMADEFFYSNGRNIYI